MTIYQGDGWVDVPNVDLLTYLFETTHSRCKEDSVIHAEAHDPSKGITKAHARDLTKQFAHFFRHEYGIGKNGPGSDVVMVVSAGQSALSCLFFGVIAAEGIYSAGSPMNTPSDLARQLRDGPGKAIVCSKDALESTLQAAKEAGLSKRQVLVLESYPEIKLYSADGTVSCDFRHKLDWRVITNSDELQNSKICILYSSGTTGLPKGVLVSHENLVAEIHIVIGMNREVWDKREPWKRRSLAHLPAAHIAGVVQYFGSQMVDDVTLYWMPKFNLDDFIKYVKELQINTFFSVPPIFTAIAKHPAITDQFKQVNFACVGAAPISAEVHAAAGKKMPNFVIAQVWGLSETTGAATSTIVGATEQAGSQGVLIPNVSVRLVDDDENDVPTGEPGEVLMKGPIVTKGYHNNPEANAKAFTKDGWLRTGDIMRMDSNKLWHIVDRKKELIKYKGLQVAPAELEGIIEGNPSVADVGVIGVPFRDTEAPKAFVVLTPAAKGKLSEQELTDYVHSKVADYKKLRGGLVFVDAVPRSPSGKILRRQLRDAEKRGSKL